MTVAELIEYLQTLPQDLPVAYRLHSEQVMLEPDDIGVTELCFPRPTGGFRTSVPICRLNRIFCFRGIEMMVKLTEAQKRALNTLLSGKISYTEWGGKTLTGLPEGIKNRGTLFALHREGLVRTWKGDGFRTVWAITDAGRAALERSSHDQKSGQ